MMKTQTKSAPYRCLNTAEINAHKLTQSRLTHRFLTHFGVLYASNKRFLVIEDEDEENAILYVYNKCFQKLLKSYTFLS